MSSKRKSQSLGLERRVRPKKNEDWELEPESSDDGPSEADVSEEDIRRGCGNEDDQTDSEDDSEQQSEVNTSL